MPGRLVFVDQTRRHVLVFGLEACGEHLVAQPPQCVVLYYSATSSSVHAAVSINEPNDRVWRRTHIRTNEKTWELCAPHPPEPLSVSPGGRAFRPTLNRNKHNPNGATVCTRSISLLLQELALLNSLIVAIGPTQ